MHTSDPDINYLTRLVTTTEVQVCNRSSTVHIKFTTKPQMTESLTTVKCCSHSKSFYGQWKRFVCISLVKYLFAQAVPQQHGLPDSVVTVFKTET